MQQPVKAAHKEMVDPIALGIANGAMWIAKVKKEIVQIKVSNFKLAVQLIFLST